MATSIVRSIRVSHDLWTAVEAKAKQLCVSPNAVVAKALAALCDAPIADPEPTRRKPREKPTAPEPEPEPVATPTNGLRPWEKPEAEAREVVRPWE